MKFHPIDDKSLVRRDAVTDSIYGEKIVVAKELKAPPQIGTVLEVGGGRYENGVLIPMRVQAGDRILFAKYGGIEIEIDGEEFLVVEEESILGVFREDHLGYKLPPKGTEQDALAGLLGE